MTADPTLLAAGPLTAAQDQLRTLDRVARRPDALHLGYALAVDGPLDAAALAAAFADVVAAHAPLRTRYAEDGGTWVGAPPELAPTAVAVAPGEAAALAAAHRAAPFDLARGAPARAALLRTGPERHVLLLTLHHIAADGWGLRVLCGQLTRAYRARLAGSPAPPEPTDGAWRATLHRHAGRTSGPAADDDAAWWVDRLRGATSLAPVPGAGSGPARRADVAMLRQVVVLPDELSAAMQVLAREAGASRFVVLLAALRMLVARWTGCTDAVLGTLAANRPTPESAELLGAHYTGLLLDGDLGRDDPTLAECLLRTAARTVGVLDRQELPFRAVSAALARDAGWDAARVPTVMLMVDRHPMDTLRLELAVVTPLHLYEGAGTTAVHRGGPLATVPAATVADLSFFARERGPRLTLSALHPRDVVDERDVAGALDSLVETLAALCDTPELPLAELPAPVPGPAVREDGPGTPSLRPIDTVAPAEALSPVGPW